jgi:hypothetical protein
MMSTFDAALILFDDYNRQDPRTFLWRDIEYPQEYFFAIALHNWVIKLSPKASEELLLASRSQHIGRWEIPRDDYPEGREPYLKWRKDLALRHAAITGRLMKQASYEEEQIERVSQIILKKRIKADAEVQTMENALCLVFLEYQYEDFRDKHNNDPEKIINILYKSLLKMDASGHEFALALKYTDEGLGLIKAALNRMK